MNNFTDKLREHMAKHRLSQVELSKLMDVVPSVVSTYLSSKENLTYARAKQLNRIFQCADFHPFTRQANGEVCYNKYGNLKTNKVNEFKPGDYIINLRTHNIERVSQVKWFKSALEWIYKTSENPNEWVSEYQLDKANKQTEEKEGEAAFLELVQEQLNEKKVELQQKITPEPAKTEQPISEPEKPVSEEKPICTALAKSKPDTVDKSKKLKGIIISLVEQLLDLL